MQRVACPLCGGRDQHVVARTAGEYCFRIRTVICRGCGLLYRNPQPDEEESRRFYRSLDRFYRSLGICRLSDEAFLRAAEAARERLGLMELNGIQPPSRILDVGCGNGAFVAEALAAGFQAVGIDPDSEASASCREKGLPVECLTLEAFAAATSQRFDVITVFHVLEHVARPVEFLRLCGNLLKPNGRLFIEVPDAGCFFVPARLFLAVHHLTHFTKNTLAAAITLAGLSLQHASSMECPDAPSRSVYKVLWAVAERTDDATRACSPVQCDDYGEVLRYIASCNRDYRYRYSWKTYAKFLLGLLLGPWTACAIVRALKRIAGMTKEASA